jgi:hypothetical protein
MTKPALLVQGMHGMGDCLHQRAILRQLMQTYDVTLETSWASMYHDLVADGLKLVRRNVALRTQTKNAEREAALFKAARPANASGIRVRYGGAEVRQTASKTVLEAMCHVTGTDYATADYRLDVPDVWTQALLKTLGDLPARAAERPWLVYRPLVARPEWRGSLARNADPKSYAKLFQTIRDTFFVISVADLVPGREWIVGPQLQADLAFHQGELTFELLAALFKRADVVYTSSGFAAILGPAVGTPTISIVGGYESVGCHSSGARFAPYIAIGPKVECGCWTSQCTRACDKTFNMDAASDDVFKFVSELDIQISDNTTPFSEMFAGVPDVQAAAPAVAPAPGALLQRRMLAMPMHRNFRA